MTNFQIITNEAINAGLYTAEQAQEIFESGRSLPLHTFKEWQRMGYRIRKGEHAKLTCFIWRFKNKTGMFPQGENDVEIDESHFYKTKAHFFDDTQVERKALA